MAPSSYDSPRVGVLLALSLMVIGGLLRGWAASWGFVSDEICWIFTGGVHGNWANGETAVNPPAIRMVIAAFTTDHWLIPHLGRGWSVVAGTAAIGLMFWLGRLLGQDKNVPGFLAASYLTILFLAIEQSGLYRSYATLQLVLIWHLIALVKVVDGRQGPPERRWITQLVVTAALLPQVHYIGVAIVFLEGVSFAVWLRDPRFIRHYIPAGLLFAPLGWRIVTESSEHMAPDPDRMRNLTDLFRVCVDHPAVTVLVLLGWILFKRRQRIVLLGAVWSSFGLIAVASYHSARADLGIVPYIYQIPLMAALPVAIVGRFAAGRWARALAWVGLLGYFVVVAGKRSSKLVLQPRPQNGPPLLARDLEAGNWSDDRRTYLYPPSTIQSVYFYLEHQRLLSPCPVAEGPVCFVYRERVLMQFENRDIPPSYVVLFSQDNFEQRFVAQCRLAPSRAPYWIWDCPNGWKAP